MGEIQRRTGVDRATKGKRDHRLIFATILMLFLVLPIATILEIQSISIGLKPALGREVKQQEHSDSLGNQSLNNGGERESRVAESEKLTEEEGQYLISVARKTIENNLFKCKDEVSGEAASSAKMKEQRGTFVTLTIDGRLRGCIGHITPQESVLDGVKVNALNAAFRDPRFSPLSKKEWEKVEVEVSILTEPKPLAYSDGGDLLNKLRSGVDGVIIKKGFHQATFLPQVWEQLPDKNQFLAHLCMKAGLDSDAWRKEKLEVSLYQVQAFEE